MKHIRVIKMNPEHQILWQDTIGYCEDIGEYLYGRMSGGLCSYRKYYILTEEQYREIMSNFNYYADMEFPGGEEFEQRRCSFYEKYLDKKCEIGGDYLRTYRVNHRLCFKYVGTLQWFGPLLYEDKKLYFHLFYDGRHYAVPANENSWGERWAEYEDMSMQHINFNGEDVVLCYGKEITSFEGEDDWTQLLNELLDANEYERFLGRIPERYRHCSK